MKIVYFGDIHSTDSDFPLVRTLQQKGHEVFYFIPLVERFKRGGIIDLKSIKDKPGLYSGNEFDELNCYANYIDLSHLFFINFPKEGKKHFSTWVTFIKTYRFIKLINADVMHLVWPLSWLWTYLYRIKIPKLLIVHDPIRHSNITSVKDEEWRKRAFAQCDKLVLLNETQKYDFQNLYHIDPKKIVLNKMGYFDYISNMDYGKKMIEGKYIIFFGQIFSYKGLEYLCEAMKEVHKKIPDVKLLIAGKGNIYFDFTEYRKLDYIMLYNDYIPIKQLANFLCNAEFCVCPYVDATQSGVLMTAFSARLPAIVTNVGALPAMVGNNEYGMIVSSKNVNELAEGIFRLLSDNKMLEMYKSNISTKWFKENSWEIIADKYILEYQNLIRDYGK